MKAANSASVSYAPGIPPNDEKDLGWFLTGELQKIAAAINALAAGHLDKSSAAPLKLREGDIRFADGTNWNPGAGQGVYAYYGSAWHLLG